MTPNQICYQVHQAHRLLPHGTRPTRLHVRIARTLARWSSPTPSHGKLARAVGCCVRTVQNALGRLRELGLLSWKARFETTRTGTYRRSNHYLFDAFCLFLVEPPKKERIKVLNPISPLGKLQREALLVKWGLAPATHTSAQSPL
jgi:DNA-binding transcriptional MocR family regulator